MSRATHRSSFRTAARGALAVLALALAPRPAAAQVVPAIVNTYRANPQDVSTARTNRGTINLTAGQIRELYFESFVAGRCQGTPNAAGTFGLNAAGTGYPTLAAQLAPRELMPRMPVVRRAGLDGAYGTADDELILYVRIAKIPTRQACQAVVDNMAQLGLLPTDDPNVDQSVPAQTPQNKNEPWLKPVATGYWRVLIHRPRGKGAPPAPSLYYPEAIGALTPARTDPENAFKDWNTVAGGNQAVHADAWRVFWGGDTSAGAVKDNLQFRWRDWDRWVRNVWTATPTGLQQDADIAQGLMPMPWFLQNPETLFSAAEQAGGIDRTAAGDWDKVKGSRFFDPRRMWENRLLDADGSVSDGSADLSNVANWSKRLPPELGGTASDANRPIEIRVHCFDDTGTPGTYVADTNNRWWEPGIYTSGAEVGPSVLPTQFDTRTASPSNGDPLLGVLATPIDLAVNLVTGEVRPAATEFAGPWTPSPGAQPINPGLGLVELQFEYETCVPGENTARTQWGRNQGQNPAWKPFGNDDAWGGTGPNRDDTTVANLRGATRAADQPVAPDLVQQYAPAPTGPLDATSGTAQIVRDPLGITPGTNQDDEAAVPPVRRDWRVRRFSGWPFNPTVALGATPPAGYVGGPLVCRFVVSSLAVLPQDRQTGSTLADHARYDPGNGLYYPQPDVYRSLATTSGLSRDYHADLERALFLIGYRPDSPQTRSSDYFLPLAPGGASSPQRVLVQTTERQAPGGTVHLFSPTGYALQGANDAATPEATLGKRWYGFDYDALKNTISPNAPGAMVYFYDLRGTRVDPAQVQDPRADLGVKSSDAAAWDARAAFDGLTTGGSVSVAANYGVGRLFDVSSVVDRIELFTADGSASTAGVWTVEVLNAAGAWVSVGTLVGVGPNQATVTPNIVCFGVRARNTGTPAAAHTVAELNLITRADVLGQCRRAPVAPVQSSDTAIVPSAMSGSNLRLSSSTDRELNPRANSQTPLELRVDVPRYQLPSRDAVERQLLAERGGSPTSYTTVEQPCVPGSAGTHDRYRGELLVYADDAKTYVKDVDDSPTTPVQRLTARSWDASLYQLAWRSASLPASYQFVRWYEEDSGAVGQTNLSALAPATGWGANLARPAGGNQRVAVESYSPLDVEFSVAYERKLTLAEKLIDFGKALHGAVSQWVPVTVTNEGNVPLRQVKLYIEFPLTPVQLADAATVARLAQSNAVPSWFYQPLAVGATGEAGDTELSAASTALALIPPPAPGALAGRTVSNVFLRVGRNLTGAGAQALRVPLGQPMGNYVGRVRVFVDDLGTAGNDIATDLSGNPLDNPAKIGCGAAATAKFTVQESPLARISDFQDNDVNRNLESANAANTQPYDPLTGRGTYQPAPVFDTTNYADPDTPDATPTLAVHQDLSQMTAAQPNSSDLLTVMWSRFRSPGAGAARWDVWFQQAARPVLPANMVFQTNYRSFGWPATSPWTNPQSAAANANERNLYPNVCVVPGTGNPPEFLLLWHNERDDPTLGKRSSSLQFFRYQGASRSALMRIADDASGQGLVNKQVARALVTNVAGLGGGTNAAPVLWVAWQSGDAERGYLGFNAVQMPTSITGAGNTYYDAITPPAAGVSAGFRSYRLQTPTGLTNLSDPALLPSYRHEAANTGQIATDPRAGNLRLINAFYSAWSPLWQNQDIYWTRYRALADPNESSAGDNVTDWITGLRNSPMAEDAYRLVAADVPGPVTATLPALAATMTLTSLPGGRVPFSRVTDELLETNAEHVAYAAAQIDWVMPPSRPRVSYCNPAQPGTRRVEVVTHRGFADTLNPLTDRDPAGAAVPLVQLKVYVGASLYAQPPDSTTSPTLQPVGLDLANAVWDEGAAEWVLPLDGATTGGAILAARGVRSCRVHPGLGRVGFNKALWSRGNNLPIFVYASYRPCAWRMTRDTAVDSQPTAAFDWWERLVLVWRRTLESGRGQLYYRTFSAAVPVLKPPLAAAPTVTDLTSGGAVPVTVTTEDRRDGMVNLPFDRLGHRVQVGYSYNYEDPTTHNVLTGNAVEQSTISGLGPERPVPVDGIGSESQPCLAPEFYLAGYPLGLAAGGAPALQQIMSGRFWLAWVSTRDLYKPNPTAGQPPLKGQAVTHVYFGAFQPEFGAAAETR